MSGARAIWWSGTIAAPATPAPTSLPISVVCCCEPPSKGPRSLIDPRAPAGRLIPPREAGEGRRAKRAGVGDEICYAQMRSEDLPMKTLIVEHTAPFQGLPELVADAEGLFAREGLDIEWVDTSEGADLDARTDVLDPKSPSQNLIKGYKAFAT